MQMTPLLNIIRSREHPVKHTTLSIKKPIENKNKVLAINGEEGLPALLLPIPSRESPPNQVFCSSTTQIQYEILLFGIVNCSLFLPYSDLDPLFLLFDAMILLVFLFAFNFPPCMLIVSPSYYQSLLI